MLRLLPLLLILIGGGQVLAQTPKTPPANPVNPANDPRFFPLKDVKPGLKGVGKTIFQGDRVEEFGVEVLGILDGQPAPGQSLIIVKLSGANAERTFVFAGMSGSPVFVNGRLLGAVSYSFPFSKEPIGAVTPIEQMVAVFEQNQSDRQVRGPVSFRDMVAGQPAAVIPDEGWAARPVQVDAAAAFTPSLAPFVGQTFVPIATPLAVSGLPGDVVAALAPQFERLGFRLVAGGTSGAAPIAPMAKFDDATLGPGRTIAVHLAEGDFSLSAAGTVTWRDGETVLAFGHPFFPPGGIGGAGMPMSEGEVITVIPNLNNSFKLVAPKNPVGTISQDRSTGIKGRLGEAAPLIPVTLKVTTSRGIVRDYKFQVIQDTFLTPLLVNLGVVGSLGATERTLGDLTLQMDARIKVAGQPEIELGNSFVSRFNPANFLGAAVATPVSVLLGSGFENLKIEGISVDVSAVDNRTNGVLQSLWLDKTEVRAGETLEIRAFARRADGSTFVERIPLTVPADARPGVVVVTVGDGSTLSQGDRRSANIPDPKDVGQLVRAMNLLRKNNRLYVKLMRSDTGAVVNNEEMPSLPPSVLASLGSSRKVGGYQALGVATLVERELPPARFLITGQQTLTLEIVK